MPKLLRGALLCALVSLNGCALLPDYVGPEWSHASHISQHAPFTSDPTNYGADSLGVTAEWSKPGGGPYVELHDGATLERGWRDGTTQGYGETLGKSREEFQGRLGYRFKLPGR